MEIKLMENFTKLIEIDDNKEFWSGTRMRIYKVGLKVDKEEEDYYEYMLAEITGNSDEMLLTCVEGYKSGNSIGFVGTVKNINRFVVSAHSLKKKLGLENVYIKK